METRLSVHAGHTYPRALLRLGSTAFAALGRLYVSGLSINRNPALSPPYTSSSAP